MQINKRILKTLLFVIGVIWLGNVIFYYSKKIDGPVFTYMYTEEPSFNSLSYLMDENDKDKVDTIILPEIDNFEIKVSEENNFNSLFQGITGNTNNIENRSSDGSVRYNVYNIDLWTAQNSEGKQLESTQQDINITKIKYKTISGKEGECEIGKAISAKKETSQSYWDRPYHLFSPYGSYNASNGSYSSSAGENRQIYKAMDDIKIVGIEGKMKNEALKYCCIKLNGKEIKEDSFPIDISRGEDVDISIEYYKNSVFYEKYRGSFIVIGRDPEGTEEKINIYFSILNDKITYKDVENLLEKRGLK